LGTPEHKEIGMDNVSFYRTAVHGSHENRSWKDRVRRIFITSSVRTEVAIPSDGDDKSTTASLQNAIAYLERNPAIPFEAMLPVPCEAGTRLINILSDDIVFCTGPDGKVKVCSVGDTSWHKVTIEFEREDEEEE
jgi:hypothetical protein